jgi:shikimate kinase
MERCTVNLSKASIDTLFNRLVVNKAKTLLASKSDAEMKEFIAVHLLKEVLLQSGGVYAVDGKTVEQTVLDITAILA